MTDPGTMWSRGRYESFAHHVAPLSGILLDEVEDVLGSLRGQRVLDVGAGTGGLAVAAAERGADVTALDPASRLLEVAVARARDRGVEVRAVTAGAEAMPLPDAAFDAVVSCLGVMFARDPAAAAAELRRVAHPAGVLGVLAWCPAPSGDPFAAPVLDAAPPPPGAPAPTDWGVPGNVERWLGAGRTVRLRRGEHEWRFADVDEAVRLVDDSPLHLAVSSGLEPAGRERFRSVAREAFTALASDGRPVVRSPYLTAVAVPSSGPPPVPESEGARRGRPQAPHVPQQHPPPPVPLEGGPGGPRHDHRRRP